MRNLAQAHWITKPWAANPDFSRHLLSNPFVLFQEEIPGLYCDSACHLCHTSLLASVGGSH